MSLYHGLYIRSTSSASLPSVVADDMNVNCAEGLFSDPNAIGAGPMVYVPPTAVLMTAAASGKENVAILQVSLTGALSLVYGTPVALGSGLSQYPAPATGHFLMAQLFTPSAPLTAATTAVTNANINNVVLSAEFGGR
jgi:hypothetical protein